MAQQDVDMGSSDEVEDIEWQLEHLEEFDNVKQLELLKKEIGFLYSHGITPSEGWYDERYKMIDTYSKIDWFGLASRFHNKDDFIHDRALYVGRALSELMEERGTRPNFNLQTYYALIHEIDNVWKYYHQMYMGDETDDDVLNLIEGMKFL